MIATVIWGVAFVAQSAAAENIPTFTFNAARCLLSVLALGLFFALQYVVHRVRKKDSLFRHPHVVKNSVRAGAVCGVILFFIMTTQQFGIGIYPPQVASSGRTGFIMASYVVMIALYTWLKGKKFRLTALLSTAGCTLGLYLLCFSGGFDRLYAGDAFIFLAAVLYAVYILYIDRRGNLCDGIIMSFVQFAVCGVLSAVGMLLFESPDWHDVLRAWLPLVYTGVLSGGIGYTLQIFAQKRMPPAAASIVMSLEAVFSALAGWLILNERLSTPELLGCTLVFLSVLLSQIPERKK